MRVMAYLSRIPRIERREVGQFERNSIPVIPGRRNAASPESTNTGFSKAFEARVAGFRVRELRSRPGMTSLQFKLTHYRTSILSAQSLILI